MIKAACTLLATAVAFAAAGCGGGGSGASAGGDPGAKLVDDAGCLACHRLDDNGNAVAQALDGVGTRLDRARIDRILVDPPSGMPSYDGRFSEAERRQVVDYLLAQR